MKNERYSMYVCDFCVEIYGELTVREAFDFIQFFDQQGYSHLMIGHENSTLRLCKKQVQDEKEPPNLYEVLLKDSEETCRQLKETQRSQDEFIRMILCEDNETTKRLKSEIEKLKKEKTLNELRENSLVKEMLTRLTDEGSQDERH